MVGLAFFHFVLVELRPLIAAGISTLTISRTVFQQAYRSHGTPSKCAPECTMQECLEENSKMLLSAMASFNHEYYETGECTHVGVDEDHKWYISMFVFLWITAWILILLTCIVMMRVEMCRRQFSSWKSGAYLVSTLELVHRPLYRVMVRTYILSWIVVFIAGLTVILMLTHWKFHIIWEILQADFIACIVLLSSSQKLLSPTNMKEFSAWDLDKMRQIPFRRSIWKMLFSSNNDLYNEIGVASLEAARGNYSHLRQLVEEGYSFSLMEAIDLHALLPEKPEFMLEKPVLVDSLHSGAPKGDEAVEMDVDSEKFSL